MGCRGVSTDGSRSMPTVIRKPLGLMALVLSLLSSCQADKLVDPDVDPDVDPNDEPGVLASGFWIPDGLAVIGEEEFLFADRSGAVYHYVAGDVTRVEGIPQSRTADVFGGLQDVSLHPLFDDNQLVYIAYNDVAWRLAVARFELRDERARNLEVIYESSAFSIGSRIVWEDASHFFLSFGAGGDDPNDLGPQDLHADVGKIHRLTADGQIPPDNPILPGASEPSSIWSYGHRNPQGLHYDAVEQMLYAIEHGPLGGDELNIITAGGNYGWPLFSYGLKYDGTPLSDMTEQEAATVSILPAKFWGPNFRVAPSGLLFVEDNRQFPSWDGSFLLGALNPQHLLRYDPSTEQTEIALRGVGRVHDVAQLPSGKLLLAIDGCLAGWPECVSRSLLLPQYASLGRVIQVQP